MFSGLGPKEGHEPQQIVHKIGTSGGPVVSQQSRRPRAKNEYYRARKGPRNIQDAFTVPLESEVGQGRVRKQRAAVTQDIGAVELSHIPTHTKSVHFKPP